MTNEKTRTAVFRAISHALRHDPAAYTLEPDTQGWVPLDAPIRRLTGRRDLPEVVATSDKKRFELVDGRVRARYGHSLAEPLEHAPAVPPDTLHHGTARRVVTAILAEGLKPMARQHVHLSADRALATTVGRRGDAAPAILRADARRAHDSAVVFHDVGRGVWQSGAPPHGVLSED